jgi:hypothetical protein
MIRAKLFLIRNWIIQVNPEENVRKIGILEDFCGALMDKKPTENCDNMPFTLQL